MLPLEQHLIINPIPAERFSLSGLLCSAPQVLTATVVKVSDDIKESPVKEGDKVCYLAGRAKNICGEILVNMEMVLAKL